MSAATRAASVALILTCVPLVPAGRRAWATEATPRTTPAQRNSLTRIVERVATTRVFRITPKTLDDYFRDLVTLKSAAADEYRWRFSAATPQHGVRWADVQFERAEGRSGSWNLVLLRLALDPSDTTPDQLFETVRSAVIERLGKPALETRDGAQRASIWRLGPAQEVLVRGGSIAAPPVGQPSTGVTLEAAVPEGESED